MRNPDASEVLTLITPEATKQILLDMIDIRSPTGHESGMADYVIQRFKRAGIDAHAQQVQPGRPNAIAHMPGSGSGTNLLFTGHMDTSYSGDEDYLVGEGFRPKGTYRDGWVWGLGANNMKSGLAGLLVAMEAIAKVGVSLRGDLTFGGVVGEIEKAPVEEFQGADYSGYGVGTKHMVGHGVTADYALLAEPTGLRICTANMGCIWAKITLHGTVAHSALTNKPGTVNAIDLARSLCDDIDQWAGSFRAANTNMGEQANVTLACIKGGAPWRLSRNPHECSIYLDIRTVPGQFADDVKRQLRAVLRRFADRHQTNEPSLNFLVTDPPLVIDEGFPVVDALRGAQETIMGQASKPFLRRPGSDAVHLSRYDVPCVQFGPGGRLHPEAKGRSMHEVGDHVLLDDVVSAARIYAETALDLCNRPSARQY
ncbi:MAG TPA: M20/M25/M40 family metallo-hydrolase [Pseudolabrys sp.]|jgi:acetylornithine deacetylase/succinyl-diaminopimelate desuccinylase-like protein